MPRWIVQNVPAWGLVAVAVIGVPALAVLVQRVLRQRAPSLVRGEQNEAAGFLGAVVAVVYAIIAGFMVITLWDQYVSAADTVHTETVNLRDLAEFSGAFGSASQNRIRDLVAQYSDSVATVEWKEMARGEDSPVTQNDLGQLVTAVQRLRVRNLADEGFLGTMLTQIDEVGEARQQRLDLSGQNIPALLWLVVILASAVTLAFSLLLGIQSAWLHYTMVASVAILIGASLVLILLMEYPYSGTIAVSPAPFVQVAADMHAAVAG